MGKVSILLIILLSGCGGISPLSLLGGGGPNVAANVQAGAENNQQIVAQQTITKAERDVVNTTQTKQVETQQVDTINITNEKIPVWYLVLLVVGWLLPSPSEIARGFIGLFKKRKD
jgi:uncharacterized protein YceK